MAILCAMVTFRGTSRRDHGAVCTRRKRPQMDVGRCGGRCADDPRLQIPHGIGGPRGLYHCTAHDAPSLAGMGLAGDRRIDRIAGSFRNCACHFGTGRGFNIQRRPRRQHARPRNPATHCERTVAERSVLVRSRDSASGVSCGGIHADRKPPHMVRTFVCKRCRRFCGLAGSDDLAHGPRHDGCRLPSPRSPAHGHNHDHDPALIRGESGNRSLYAVARSGAAGGAFA